MRIVFPEGSGCVQKPDDLLFVKKLGTVDYYDTPPQNKADLIQRLRDADVVFLDYSVMDAGSSRLSNSSSSAFGIDTAPDVRRMPSRRARDDRDGVTLGP
jgi:hypothetical protein